MSVSTNQHPRGPVSTGDMDSCAPVITGDIGFCAPVQPMVASDTSTGAAPVTTGATPPRWDPSIIPPNYTLDASGVFLTDDSSRISGPIWVTATTFDPLTGDHGLVIHWLDLHGNACELAITRDELHVQGGTLAARLARGGLLLTPGEERKLLRYLALFDSQRLPVWQSATRVGWLEESDGGLAYMLPPPCGIIAATGHAPVIFQPERESPTTASMYARGTLEQWNSTVVSLCRSNPLLLFPVLAGLAAPLLRFAQLESGGFHYYGRSSHGKTTAAQVAATVWGNGADPAEAPDRAFVQKWNSTANAFEALLSAHNDGLLVLDEIHTCDAKDFGAVIYNMAGGKGRQALDRERQLRRGRKWRAMYFSTGEISVAQRLGRDGKEIHAGQLLRLIDIPIEGGTIVDAIGGHPGAHADKLKTACARCFGTAGPAFVAALTVNYDDARAIAGTVRAFLDRYAAALTPADAPAEHRRAIKRFALLMVAGELAIKLGILQDCSTEDVERSVQAVLHAWQVDGSNIPDRLRGVLNVQAFLERCESRFQKMGEDSRHVPNERAGFVGWDGAAGCAVFLFTSDGFLEACSGQDPRETARELQALGFLFARESNRYTEKRELGSGRHRVYIVRASLLTFDPQARPTGGTNGAAGASQQV